MTLQKQQQKTITIDDDYCGDIECVVDVRFNRFVLINLSAKALKT